MATLRRARKPEAKSSEAETETSSTSRGRNDSIAARAERARAERSPERSPDKSIDSHLEESFDVPVSDETLSLEIDLGPNQTLFQHGENRVHTGDSPCRLLVHVSKYGIAFRTRPGLKISQDRGMLGTISVDFDSFRWSFGGDIEVDASAGWLVGIFADPEAEIASALKEIVAGFPPRMHQDGYDPYSDDALLPDLKAALASGGGGGVPALEGIDSNDAELSGGFLVNETFMTDTGRIVVPAGTQVRMSVKSAAGLPEDLSKLEIDSVLLEIKGKVMVQVLGTDIAAITVRRVDLQSGGAVRFDYDLITEDLSNVIRGLAALLGARYGVPVGDVRPARHEGLREMVNESLEAEGATAIRDLLREHADAIPGVDLAKALGL